MTEDNFRELALSLPDAEESAHMGHPDFRVRGKIFATLPKPGKGLGMVKLKPDQQEQFVALDSKTFEPVGGKWGLRGATYVNLRAAKTAMVRDALLAAMSNLKQ
jgi:hypothetical protein